MMQVILRISPFNSTHPSPFHKDDKFKRVKMCYESLWGAGFKHFTIISDNASSWRRSFEGASWIDASGAGNFGTYCKQLEEAMEYEKVLVCEDDYLWRPNTQKAVFKALDKLELVFPYDHPSHYSEPRFAGKIDEKIVIDKQEYRACPSNTLTFATTGKFIKKHWDVLTGYGTLDHEMFTQLSKKVKLWCPVPAFATHLVEGLLSPNIKWENVANLYSE